MVNRNRYRKRFSFAAHEQVGRCPVQGTVLVDPAGAFTESIPKTKPYGLSHSRIYFASNILVCLFWFAWKGGVIDFSSIPNVCKFHPCTKVILRAQHPPQETDSQGPKNRCKQIGIYPAISICWLMGAGQSRQHRLGIRTSGIQRGMLVMPLSQG
jgi:hypothetical protein